MMRFRSVGIALVSLAVLAGGAGTAYAGSGTPPVGRGAARTAAPSVAGNPASAQAAQVSGVCDDAFQIGTTAHIRNHLTGENYASVKQFYSPTCQKNYSYLWVWQSFRDTHDVYNVRVQVLDDDTHFAYGQVEVIGTSQQEFWSQGTDTVQDCTRAEGALWWPGELGDHVLTDQRC